MIERVITASIPFEANWIFIVQKVHRDLYELDRILTTLRPGCQIVDTGGGVTEGAACSVLLAAHLIDTDAPLIILNSDNIVHWDTLAFTQMQENGLDGLILCFPATDPKWSFALTDENGIVTQVAEKNPISSNATAGLYIWARGDMFLQSARQMIEKNIRVNGEFYICPIYNESITLGAKIGIDFVQSMHGVGTPEDLETYITGVLDTAQ